MNPSRFSVQVSHGCYPGLRRRKKETHLFFSPSLRPLSFLGEFKHQIAIPEGAPRGLLFPRGPKQTLTSGGALV